MVCYDFFKFRLKRSIFTKYSLDIFIFRLENNGELLHIFYLTKIVHTVCNDDFFRNDNMYYLILRVEKMMHDYVSTFSIKQ